MDDHLGVDYNNVCKVHIKEVYQEIPHIDAFFITLPIANINLNNIIFL